MKQTNAGTPARSREHEPHRGLVILVTTFVCLFTSPSFALLRIWDNPRGVAPFFNDPNNWTEGRVPDASDTAYFSTADSDVLFREAAEVHRTEIRNAAFSFNLNGFDYRSDTLHVGVAPTDVGSLTLTNGSLTTLDETIIGSFVGAVGTIIVGAGATLNTAPVVGRLGEGTLIITDGGSLGAPLNIPGTLHLGSDPFSVFAPPGTGHLIVEGNGSSANTTSSQFYGHETSTTGTVIVRDNATLAGQKLYVGFGDSTNATVAIESGGQVSSKNDLFIIAKGTGSTAHVTVTDATSRLDTGAMTVGESGHATLDIKNQAVVMSGATTLGMNAGSTGIASVDDATWDITGALNVGVMGQGLLDVRNGGQLSSGVARIGGVLTGALNRSRLTVTGANTGWASSGDINVEHGLLEVLDLASVAATGSLNLLEESASALIDTGANLTAASVLNNGAIDLLDGGEIEHLVGFANSISGRLNIDAGAIRGGIFTNSGELSVTGGGVVEASSFSAGGISTTRIAGAGSSIISSGMFRNAAGPGNAFEIVDGGVVQSASGEIVNNGHLNVGGSQAQFNVAADLYVGGFASQDAGVGVVNIDPGGTVAVGGTLKLWTAGKVNINGGVLRLAALDLAGGAVNHNAGELAFTGDLRIGTGGPYASFTLNGLQTLSVQETTTIEALGSLTLDGGTFNTSRLVRIGLFQFNTGTFNLTGEDFAVGVGGLFGDDVRFGAGQIMNVTSAADVQDDGVLTLANGRFSAGTLRNAGEIRLDGSSSRLGGGTVVNTGLIHGEGRIAADLKNGASGEVRANDGDRLHFTGGVHSNTGRIESLGGEIEFDGHLVNEQDSGNIIGRDTRLRFDGGLQNDGGIGLSFGQSDVFGDIDNRGLISVSGNSEATFYDDFINNGTTQISDGSTAVFFGSVSGGGIFSGAGTLFFEGDLAPGNSPGLLTVEPDVIYGASHTLTIELGGTIRGVSYDALDVIASATLNGTLEVDLIDGFSPVYGDEFEIIRAEVLSGNFSSLILPGLDGQLVWQTVLTNDPNGFDTFVLTAVPLPGSLWLLISGALLALRRGRTTPGGHR